MQRPIIGFLSDLGILDDAVGLCKGLILKICSDAQIIDISHMVTPFDIDEGSLYLKDTTSHFPKHTVFACVVFPETGTDVDSIAVRNEPGQIYVSSDNGLLTQVIKESSFDVAYKIENPTILAKEPSSSFYGRDIIVSAAAHIARGFPLPDIGRELSPDDIHRLTIKSPTSNSNAEIYGEVSLIDKNFGNVWTNISLDFLKTHNITYDSQLEIEFSDTGIKVKSPIMRTFGQTKPGHPLIYINSRGDLALGMNRGNFASVHHVTRATRIKVRVLSGQL